MTANAAIEALDRIEKRIWKLASDELNESVASDLQHLRFQLGQWQTSEVPVVELHASERPDH